ncbi:LamG-like jellyroll fold domain-containing protein [Actinomadura fulvescens]|uniref:Polymorphic toxin-type HINT domain-containing protein n=1 Tax=Actinomadura fulvescens TaxID=46160 RepID=A0ABP6C974_9ACTN
MLRFNRRTLALGDHSNDQRRHPFGVGLFGSRRGGSRASALVRALAVIMTLVLLGSADGGAAGPMSAWYTRMHPGPVHGPDQRWGSADAEYGDVAVGGRRNRSQPRTLRSRYPLTRVERALQKSAQAAQNKAQVGKAPSVGDPKVKGFDAATSRELAQARDAYSRTFSNADGTQSTELSPRPINYRRSDGSWAPIDTRIVPVGEQQAGRGNVPAQGWRNSADSVDVRLAPRVGSGPLARVGLNGGYEVAYEVHGGSTAVGEPAERGVTYPRVWSDTDLKLDIGSGGVKETIVLRSPKAPTTFTFPLALKGLTAKVVGDQVVFTDSLGQVQARMPAGNMTDSATAPAVSHKVSYSIVSVGGAPALQVSVDPKWLSDPARTFPVMVDSPVETGVAGASISVDDSGSTDGGKVLTVGSRSAAYLSFPQLVEKLKHHRIYGASLWMLNYYAVTCKARPVTVHPVTEQWVGRTGLKYPGPSVGRAIARASFSQGHIWPAGSTTSKCPPKKGQLFNLGKGGRDLVQRWVDNPQNNNLGLSVRDASSDDSGYKKFTGHDTANPPTLFVTHTPYNAKYAITKPVPTPPVMQNQAGKIKISVTNMGAENWTPGTYYLAYRAYNSKGKLVVQQRSANLTTNVAYGQRVNLDAEIKPLPVGTYSLDFTMVRTGGKVFTDAYVPPIRLILRVINLAPVVQELYPLDGYQTPTLSPQLWAKAVDIDAPPGQQLKYEFKVCEKTGSGPPANCISSGDVSTHAWAVPAGKLSWSRTYQWQVGVKDAGTTTWSPFVMFQTSVPQPEITSRLSEAQDRAFDPVVGNFTVSAADASVATVGPSLALERTYNSLDPRRDSPFGAGWSTQFDMRLIEDNDGSGNVVVGYPDGQQVRYGRNPDGTYSPPQGRQATLTLDGGQGKLVDKDGNIFEFSNKRLIKISDAGGHTITLTYDLNGNLSKATAAGGRSLTFTWSGTRVATVATNPVDGKALTWSYTYEGNRLAKVCAPGNRCTVYEYGSGSHYRSTVLDTRPESYWRLNEDEAESAGSQISVNLGADAGTYKNVTLQAPGALAGSADTAATFDGTSSQVALPAGTVKKSRDIAVELWFKNDPTGPGGPLMGYQDKPLDGTSTVGVPVLYTGTDGKLRGQFWSGGAIAPITSATRVNDGTWHHAVLSAMGSTQTLYLDGQPVGTLTGQTPNHHTLTHNQIGAAYASTPGSWTGWGTSSRRFYRGAIDEVAVYQHPLGPDQVSAHYREATQATDQMTKVTLPSGKIAAEVEYDTVWDRVSEYTDNNGGTWKIRPPQVYGGKDGEGRFDLRRAIEVRDPGNRTYLYEQDGLTGQMIRVGIPLGTGMRSEDRETPTPDPTDTCQTPDPEDPDLCTVLPGNPGDDPDFIDHVGIRNFVYDDRGFLKEIENENGDKVLLGYDSRGNITSRTTCRATGVCNTEHHTYPTVTNPSDPRNDRPIEFRDARSSSVTDNRYRTTYSYTSAGNLLSQVNPEGGGQTNYTYTDGAEVAIGGGTMPSHLVRTVTDPRGAVTRYWYNSAGDVAQVKEQSGLTTTYTYDAIGRVKTRTEISDSVPAGVVTSYGYDDWSNLTSETAPATTNAVTGAKQQQRTDHTYDVDGNVTKTQLSDTVAGGEPRTTTYDYDDHNRLERVIDAYGHETVYDRDRYGNVVTMVDADDNRYEYAYTARNMLAQVRLRDFDGDAEGEPSTGDSLVVRSYTYDYAGRLDSDTDAMGRQIKYDYYPDDLPKSATLVDFDNPDGTKRNIVLSKVEYDAAGNPTKQVTNNGKTVVDNTYDKVGRLESTALDPTGLNRRTTFRYDLGGKVTRVSRTGNPSNVSWPTSSTPETVDLGYDLPGRLTTQTSTDGTTPRVTSYTYDQRDLRISMTDPRGNVTGADKAAFTTNYVNDEIGRQTRVTAPPVSAESNGGQPATTRPVTLTGYNAFDEATEIKDPLGNISRTEYDRLGQPVKEISPAYTPPGTTTPLTPTTVTHYDPLGRTSKVVDPRQNETRYSYDRLGRVQVVDAPNKTNDDRVQWQYDYTRTGELLSVVDPNGARSEATYDKLGRPITGTQIERRPAAVALTTRYGYDDVGNLLTTTAPSGATTTNTYDTAGALTKTVDPANVTTHFGYDDQGRRVRASDGLGRTNKLAFNALGQLVTEADLKPDGTQLRKRTLSYDLAGNVKDSTDALTRKTTFEYDALDQLTKQTEPVSASASTTTTYGYDAAGNRTRFTDGRRHSTVYTINSLGLRESIIEPATTAHPNAADRTWTTSYDEAGNAVKTIAPGGVTRERTFDANDRLSRETGTGAQTAERVLGYDAAGRLIKVNAGSDTNVYSYNDRGQLLSAEGPSGQAGWNYNTDGQPITRSDAAGTSTFGYSNGRLSTVRDGITNTTQTLGYNPAGQANKIDYGAGRVRTVDFDDLGRARTDTLKNGTDTVVASTTYGYDDNDHTTSKTTTGQAGSGDNTYDYDHAGRLTSWKYNGSTTNYEWDDSGNRTKPGDTTATFDERNRRLTDGNSTYTYTPRGTLATTTNAGTTETFDFDAFDRQTRAGNIDYTYDGLDRLASRNGATFSYNGLDDEPVADGTTSFSRGPSHALLGTAQGTTKRLTVSNAHGDIVGGFAPDGPLNSLTDSTAYDPFGQPTATSGNRSSIGYQGDWTDPTTSQVNMGARWYTPTTGTFNSRDDWDLSPTPNSINANRYTYANASPLDRVDPSGHASCPGGGGSGAVGFVGDCWNQFCWDQDRGFHPCGYEPPCFMPVSYPGTATVMGRPCRGGSPDDLRRPGGSGGGGSNGGSGGGGGGGGISPEEQERRERERKRRKTEAAKKRQERKAQKNPVPRPPKKPYYPDSRQRFPDGPRKPAPVTGGTKNVVKDTSAQQRDIRRKAVEANGPVTQPVSRVARSAPEVIPGAVNDCSTMKCLSAGSNDSPNTPSQPGEGIGKPKLQFPEFSPPNMDAGGCFNSPQMPMCELGRRLGKAVSDVVDYGIGHLGASATSCFIVCVGITFQDGQFWLSYGGAGLSFKNFRPNFGASISGQWTSRRPDDQGPFYGQACGFAQYGGCIMGTPESADGSRKGWVGASGGAGWGWFGGSMHSGKMWDIRDPWNLQNPLDNK